MPNKNKIIAVACTIIALLGIGFFMASGSASPKKSLLEIGQAVKNHDLEKFEKYVDLESFFNKGFEAYVMADMKNRDMNFTQADLGMAGMMRGIVVPTLVMTARRAVETGNLSSEKHGKYNDALSIADDFGANGWEYKSAGSARKEGKTAILPLTVHDNQLGRDFVFNIKFAKTDEGIWRVKELENAAALIMEREAAVKEKLDELNAKITVDMNRAVELTEQKNTMVKDTSSFFAGPYFLTNSFTAKNTLDKDIKSLSVSLTVFDKNDKKIYVNFDSVYSDRGQTRYIKAHEEKNLSSRLSLREYIEDERRIIDVGLDDKKVVLEVQSISFADDTEMKQLKALPPYVKK